MESVFDLSIPQPAGKVRRDPIVAKQQRQDRAIGKMYRLLESHSELRGVYGPADQIADTLRWSA